LAAGVRFDTYPENRQAEASYASKQFEFISGRPTGIGTSKPAFTIVRIPHSSYFFLALIGISLIGAATLLLTTRWGIGLSPDSITYIGAARSLLMGNGLSVPTYSGQFSPMTHFPPLFSGLLSVIGSIGIAPLEGARWLNAIFFAANIALVGVIVYFSTGSIFLSLLGSVLMVVLFPMVQAHSMAWSEPLFIFFGFLGLFLLALYMGTARF